MTRVLVVEDEESYRDPLTYQLRREGFEVFEAATGHEALDVFDAEGADIVLLDLMLPGLSGTEVCRELRQRGDVPVIMVTAKDSEIDKVVGLELGADDYVTKPYSFRELLARVRAVLRRRGGEPRPAVGGVHVGGAHLGGPRAVAAPPGGAQVAGTQASGGQASTAHAPEPRSPEVRAGAATLLRAGPVVMDVDRHIVTVNGQVVALPLKEFELLEVLLRQAGRVLTRGQLIDRVWGSDYVGDTKTLDVHIKRIRAKIEPEPAVPQLLLTVRGLGYRIVDVAPVDA